jgi:hypothetical protein
MSPQQEQEEQQQSTTAYLSIIYICYQVHLSLRKSFINMMQNILGCSLFIMFSIPDRKVDIKDNQLGIKLIPMLSTWDQVDPIFPVR